jgi:predicted PurR-regulated permease PerM
VAANKFSAATSIFLTILLGYLTYQILQPFLYAIAWAVVFTIVFYPVYVFLLRYLRYKSLASVCTLLILVVIILGPVTYLSFILVDEIGNFVNSFNKDTLQSLKDVYINSSPAVFLQKLGSRFGIEGIGSGAAITESVRSLGKNITSSLTVGITNVAAVLLNFIFMLFAVFFFLKDGASFLSRLREYLPFSEEDKNRLISRAKDMVISTVYGGVLIAVIQGILCGIAFAFLGIGAPVLWGSATTVVSFLPLIGTFAVWGPASAYLFIEGDYWKGIILVLYGVLVISMVDNFLRPIIVSGRTKMPTLAVFFSVLGGIKLFGLIGFIMGPLVLALFVSIFEIFRHAQGGENAY